MLEILSVHNEIGTYHFHEVREGRETFDAEDAAPTDDFTESLGGKLRPIGNAMLHSTIMTLTAQVDPLPTTPVFNTPRAFRCHSDKKYPVRLPLASPFSPIPRNAIHHPSLLLGPFYPCQPNPTHQQPLTRVEFVRRPHAFSNHLEYHLELSCHHFFVYVGGCSSEYAVS